ncbi:MAG: circularly permuted type 2 ATP-grasp protein [Clostridiales bacterium]|nr:circularly permuted type 2 ATP-grasp protein [Clostridiales bacterium]
MDQLIQHAGQINQQLSRYGVKFGIYKNGVFNERLFPFDAISRVITQEEWVKLEKGLIQRVDALNAFLRDIYGPKKSIIKDNVVPEEFVYLASGYMPECEGFEPPGGIYSHISGIDLVQDKDGEWFVLEDNLRVPSGASYPLIARELCRKCSPETFKSSRVVDNRNYGALLREAMSYVNRGGINVILTPGRYNAAYYEHSLLAEMSQAVLAEASDLVVVDNVLHYRSYDGQKRVGTVYRRISDEFLDPLYFHRESLIGIPNILSAYRSGNVALVNAPGNGVADDKGIYYFVPKMVKYYLGEEPLLKNAPTYLPFYEKDRKFVLENIERLVIKDVAEAGGYGVVFGSSLPKEKLLELKERIELEPRRFIAQEVIDFKDLPLVIDGETVDRKADFRAYVLTSAQTRVWPSGLTRFSTDPASFIVNSSQGGGFKDTWVLY